MVRPLGGEHRLHDERAFRPCATTPLARPQELLSPSKPRPRCRVNCCDSGSAGDLQGEADAANLRVACCLPGLVPTSPAGTRRQRQCRG